MDSPEYLSAYVPTDEAIILIDVLQLRGELWLVPEWYEWPDKQLQTPAVAVRLDGHPFQRSAPGAADLTVNNQVPTAVLRGEPTPEQSQRFQVIVGPSDHFGKLPMKSVQ